MSGRRRRLDGWGFEGEGFAAPPALRERLERRIGRGEPFPRFDPSSLRAADPRPLPELPGNRTAEPLARLACARGQGLPDLLRLRSGTVPALPDAVLRPRDAGEVEAALAACAGAGVRVIPRGGGTSVTGGVNFLPGAPPAVCLDLSGLAGLESLDETSGLALFGAGTAGPEIEAALAGHDLTLGHFPQSWELSSLGGWIATRASGQESLGYGGISDLVAGVEVVAPAGRLALAPQPASAAGPDLRQLVLGSEGRLGVVTRATVRVRRRPRTVALEGALVPTWESGLEAVRALVRERLPLGIVRLSDPPETEAALAVGLAGRRTAPFVRGWLTLRGAREGSCLLLFGASGDESGVEETLEISRTALKRRGAIPLGRGPGRRWLADRFRHPYLRDGLLDLGIATDTLETAAPWSRLPALYIAARGALAGALDGEDERTAVLCHVSHPYEDGASLYFTFFFRCPRDPDRAIARWATLKRAATSALAAGGGTLSHHHGVGSWHAPWLEREVGESGVRVLAAAAAALDPDGILNPHALLDPTDRLEA